MFGEDSVPKMFKGEKFYVCVNDTKADIDLSSLVMFLQMCLGCGCKFDFAGGKLCSR